MSSGQRQPNTSNLDSKHNWIGRKMFFTRQFKTLNKMMQTYNDNGSIKLEDMEDLQQHQNFDEIGQKLSKKFNQETQTITNSTIYKYVFEMYSSEILVSLLLVVLENICKVGFAVLITFLFDSFEKGDKKEAYFFTGGAALVWIIQYVFSQNGFKEIQLLALRVKSSLFYSLYNKILRLSCNNFSSQFVGTALNALIQFHQLLQNNGIYLFVLAASPIGLIGLTGLLINSVGYFGLLGVFIQILAQIIHYFYGKYNSRHLEIVGDCKDNRMKVLGEMVEGVKVIKMYSWQRYFKDKVMNIRNTEKKHYIQYGLGFSIEVMLSQGISAISMVTIFITTSFFTNTELTTNKIIISVLYITLIKLIVIYSGQGVSLFFQLSVLVERFAKILDLKELKMVRVNCQSQESLVLDGEENIGSKQVIQMRIKKSKNPESVEGVRQQSQKLSLNSTQQPLIKLTSLSVYFKSPQEMTRILHNVNLQVKPTTFLGIAGKVGSGKSILLTSILKQIPYFSGEIDVKGQIAYVEQNPIILSGTVKENILFGIDYQEERYQEAVQYSCLRQDLDNFQNGDQSHVGDRGSGLSGGQRTRLSIARAIYSDRDIYVLDDPLSSLDPKVRTRVFQNIQKLNKQKQKTVIISTHHFHLLEKCHEIILLTNGTVQKVEYSQLVQQFLIQQIFKNNCQLDQKRQLNSNHNNVQIREDVGVNCLGESGIINQSVVSQERSWVRLSFFLQFLKYVKVNKWNYLVFGLTILFFGLSQTSYALLITFLSSFDDIQKGIDPTFTNENQLWITLASLSLLIILFQILRVFLLNLTLQLANSTLHQASLTSLLKTKHSYYIKTAAGAILDKFSVDLGNLDVGLLPLIYGILVVSFIIGIQFIFIAVGNIVVLGFAIVIGVLLFIWNSYVKEMVVQLKQIEFAYKSPVISLFSETIQSLIIIHQYNQQKYMKNKIYTALSNSLRTSKIYRRIFRIYTMYGIYISTCIVVGIYFMNIAVQDVDDFADFAFTTVFLVQINDTFYFLMTWSLNAFSNMINFRRMKMLINLERQRYDGKELLKSDLERSQELFEVYVKDLCLSYENNQQYALDGVQVGIKKGQKVGIVGRTGSGKSTMVQALLRLHEPTHQSTYLINGNNALEIDLYQLRSMFTSIPQNPFLYSGTIKQNLDPYNNHTDEQINQALRQAKIYDSILQMQNDIETQIEGDESSLSVGQKQLLCLARAILHKKQILILDEASASIDFKTQSIFQEVIEKSFKDATVISIAHRLKTISKYDKIIVMGKGKILEMGKPEALMRKKGQFWQMMAEEKSQS